MQKIKAVLSNSSSDHERRSSDVSTTDPRMSSETSPTSHGSGTSGGMSNPAGKLPVQEGVRGRAEESGQQSTVTGQTPAFTDPHSHGHDHSSGVSNNFDLKSAVHDHVHLGHKEHEHHHTHQTEEVTRTKDHERHVHHLQHHIQPVLDTKHSEAVHREQVHPTTRIDEKHGSTKEDIAAFAGLQKHRDETHDHGIVDRQVVDKGEIVNERVIHHVHNVVQPILKTDIHKHEVIHTTIPSHHVTHEAPTIHDSLQHGAVSKADFLKSGGQLGSGLSHHESGLLTEGGCDRSVDGVGEDLAKKLGFKSGTVSDQHKGDIRI